jgi:hypothetical protein
VHLRSARNSFVHEGQPLLGKGANRQPVTRDKARELIRQARQIINFIQAFLPENQRRPHLVRQSEVTISATVALGPVPEFEDQHES